MIPHYETVAMVRIALEHGQEPEIRRLAEDVVRAQETEIGQMRGWSARHDGPPGLINPRSVLAWRELGSRRRSSVPSSLY